MPKKIIVNGEEMEERRKSNNKATYGITWGAILLLATIVGYLFTAKSQTEMRVTKVEQDYTEITAQLRQLQNDVGWIKDTLSKKYQK
jgi:hypothetical protein